MRDYKLIELSKFDVRCVSRYIYRVDVVGEMIKSIKHKGLSKFHKTGTTAGIQVKHAKRLRLQLTILESAKRKDDLNRPGFKFHELTGNSQDRYAISVSGNWRLTFEFHDGDVYVFDYEDYH